jgi:glycosyltransferase involved in cell wall biosynthesis
MVLPAADVMVVPSDRLETFCMVALEAIACGCPVIVTDQVPEIVKRFTAVHSVTPYDTANPRRSFTWRRMQAPPERSTATRSRWRSSRKLRAPSRRPGPQAGAARQRYRAVRCQACAAASRVGQVLVGRRPLYGCGSAQPRDGPGVQGQAGAFQQVVSIPGASGRGAAE